VRAEGSTVRGLDRWGSLVLRILSARPCWLESTLRHGIRGPHGGMVRGERERAAVGEGKHGRKGGPGGL
jgi:hypothetical protein